MTFIAWTTQLHVACGRTTDIIVRTLRINQLVLKSSHMPSDRDWTTIEVATMALTYLPQDWQLLGLSSGSEAEDEELGGVTRDSNQTEMTMRFCHQPIHSMPSFHMPTLDLFSLG
jgi:hypothetical protein